MSAFDALPSFDELTGRTRAEAVTVHAKQKATFERYWQESRNGLARVLQVSERRYAQLSAAYRAGEICLKFDPDRICTDTDRKLAERYGIDWMAVLLGLNQAFERNPFTEPQMAPKSHCEKQWFRSGYLDDHQFRAKFRCCLNRMVFLKSEGAANTD